MEHALSVPPQPAPDLGASESASARVHKEQKVRLQRISMAFLSYQVPCLVTAFCWYHGMVPLYAVWGYVIAALLFNGSFMLLVRSGFNLRLRDPSMTVAQMTLSVVPAATVMFLIDAGQVRGVFLLIAIVPSLYGIMALNTRQFALSSGLIFIVYTVLMAALWHWRPQTMDIKVELIQALAFFFVMIEISFIGGFIHKLRSKLRARNGELHQALDELKTAMEKIHELANHDGLTGLINRRHLFEVLSLEAARQQRTHGPFCIAMLDIDHFKQVNDTHGHQAGDTVLRTVASEVQTRLRTIDIFGRYGGEEFLMILPQTPLEGAKIKAERVRQQVQGLHLDDIAEGFTVTASIGVAEHRPNETIEQTIARADAALYRAKHGGRNRVCAEDDSSSDESDSALKCALASPHT